jgi:CRISPR/Cas system-associated exonuclease Cas4 (RecB family)
MTCYSYVAHYHKLNQKKPVHLRFDVLLKNRECEKLEYTVRRDEKDHQRLFQTAEKVLHAISQEIFYPNSGFYCTDCPFFQNCQNW